MTLDTKSNFKNTLERCLVMSGKLLDYYGSCKASCLEHHYLQYLNRLLGLSLMTVFLHMTRVTKNTFYQKMESKQYNVALDITGTVKISLEYPQLFNNIPIVKNTCRTRNSGNISQFQIYFSYKFMFSIPSN